MKSKRPHKKKKKRVGRGHGSRHGKTSCRGEKGQHSRTGSTAKPGFEGGQTTFIRRLPKRGFNNAAFKKKICILNLDVLSALNESEITLEILLQTGIVPRKCDGIKILARGKVEKPLTIHAHQFSEKAKAKIENAGGKIVVIKK